MILDADSTTCQKATFNIGPSTSTSRSWEIKVTQYGCGNEDRAGIQSTAQILPEAENFETLHHGCFMQNLHGIEIELKNIIYNL